MPIRKELRFLYPLDWPQISAAIRFERARGRCEECGRPHGLVVLRPRDGRTTKVFLATAHRNHDPGDNRWSNLAAWCQKCHLEHDREEHQRQRRLTLLKRRALGDLFLGAYPTL